MRGILFFLLFLSMTANAETLLQDDFENGKSAVWYKFPKETLIVEDTAKPGNHVVRLVEKGWLMSPSANCLNDNEKLLRKIECWKNYRFSFKVRLSGIPRVTGDVKSNHYHLFQFEYLVQPDHIGRNVCRVSSWRIISPRKWLIQGPYVYAGRTVQTYPLAETRASCPTPGAVSDTQWHEVDVQTLEDRVMIRVDGKIFFDGKHEMNDAGGVVFVATFIPDSGIKYIELDDVKVETIKEIR